MSISPMSLGCNLYSVWMSYLNNKRESKFAITLFLARIGVQNAAGNRFTFLCVRPRERPTRLKAVTSLYRLFNLGLIMGFFFIFFFTVKSYELSLLLPELLITSRFSYSYKYFSSSTLSSMSTSCFFLKQIYFSVHLSYFIMFLLLTKSLPFIDKLLKLTNPAFSLLDLLRMDLIIF